MNIYTLRSILGYKSSKERKIEIFTWKLGNSRWKLAQKKMSFLRKIDRKMSKRREISKNSTLSEKSEILLKTNEFQVNIWFSGSKLISFTQFCLKNRNFQAKLVWKGRKALMFKNSNLNRKMEFWARISFFFCGEIYQFDWILDQNSLIFLNFDWIFTLNLNKSDKNCDTNQHKYNYQKWQILWENVAGADKRALGERVPAQVDHIPVLAFLISHFVQREGDMGVTVVADEIVHSCLILLGGLLNRSIKSLVTTLCMLWR